MELSRAAHDLKQPLQAVKLLLERLTLQSDVGPESGEIVQDGLRATEQLEMMIDTLLGYSRLEENQVAVHMEDVLLLPILADLMVTLRPLAEARGLRLDYRVETDVVAWTDRALLYQALSNLIGNAVKYTKTGRVLVTVRGRSPVQVSVWDTGPGIVPGDLDMIFKPFQRSASHGAAGFGLGLSIVSQIAERIGAGVDVWSRPWTSPLPEGRRVGSRFTLTLPGRRRIFGPGGLFPESTPEVLAEGLRVGAVIGNAAVREDVVRCLEDWGCSFTARARGVEFLMETFDAAPFDALIIDLESTSRMHGFDVVDALRLRWTEALPVVILADEEPDKMPVNAIVVESGATEDLRCVLAACSPGPAQTGENSSQS